MNNRNYKVVSTAILLNLCLSFLLLCNKLLNIVWLETPEFLPYISLGKEGSTPFAESQCSLCRLDEIEILVSTAITCSSGPRLSSVIVSRIQFPVTEGLRFLLSYLSLTNSRF